jgi:hypothetical protein
MNRKEALIKLAEGYKVIHHNERGWGYEFSMDADGTIQCVQNVGLHILQAEGGYELVKEPLRYECETTVYQDYGVYAVRFFSPGLQLPEEWIGKRVRVTVEEIV